MRGYQHGGVGKYSAPASSTAPGAGMRYQHPGAGKYTAKTGTRGYTSPIKMTRSRGRGR